MSIDDRDIAGGAAPQNDGAAAYCPHCSAPVGDGVFPWPPDPTRCPACGQWIGRNRAAGAPGGDAAPVAHEESAREETPVAESDPAEGGRAETGHAERSSPQSRAMSFLRGHRSEADHEADDADHEAPSYGAPPLASDREEPPVEDVPAAESQQEPPSDVEEPPSSPAEPPSAEREVGPRRRGGAAARVRELRAKLGKGGLLAGGTHGSPEDEPEASVEEPDAAEALHAPPAAEDVQEPQGEEQELQVDEPEPEPAVAEEPEVEEPESDAEDEHEEAAAEAEEEPTEEPVLAEDLEEEEEPTEEPVAAEDVEDVEDAEPAEEPGLVEDAEPAEEPELVEDAEPAEEPELVEDAEPAEEPELAEAEAEAEEPVAADEDEEPAMDVAGAPSIAPEPSQSAGQEALDLRTVAARVAVSRMASGTPKTSRLPALPRSPKLQPPRIGLPRTRPATARRPAPKPSPLSAGTTRKRRPVRITGVTMVVVGVLILAYGTITLVWQDPWTAWQTARAQKRAKVQYDRIVKDFRKSAAAQTKLATRDWLHRQAALFNLHTPEGSPVGRLSIPKIGIHFTIVQGTEETTLQKGPAHYVETPLPGAKGKWTVGIAGHRTTYLAPFRHIDELDPGDSVTIQMPYARFTYSVEKTKIVDATDQSVLAADSAITGRKPYNRLALTACHPPFSAAQRIIVYAKLDRYKISKAHS